MRVMVFGGTGFVGSALVPKLRQRGHQVVVLTRDPESSTRLNASGVQALIGDLLEPSDFRLGLGQLDAIILLAAPRIFGKRLGKLRFRALQAEITAIYSHALEIARQSNCPIIITGGASFQTSGDQIADESWPIARFGAARIGEGIDELVARAVAEGTPKLVWLLPGQIYGLGGMFLTMYEWIRRGKFRFLGDGGNYLPRIQVEDCAEAYACALDQMDSLPTGERFIITDDVNCTTKEFMECLAGLIGVPLPGPAPSFIVKLVIGKLLYETATMNCRVTNAKAKLVLGWKLRYPSYREGLQATVQALQKQELRP